MIRLWPVQQALYSRLSGDSTLAGMVTAIADEPNQNHSFPYITLGEATAAPEDLLIESGASQTMTLHAWDRGQSMNHVKQIMDRMSLALHNSTFAVSGSQLVRCAVEFTEIFREGDNVRHGVMRVRVETFG